MDLIVHKPVAHVISKNRNKPYYVLLLTRLGQTRLFLSRNRVTSKTSCPAAETGAAPGIFLANFTFFGTFLRIIKKRSSQVNSY